MSAAQLKQLLTSRLRACCAMPMERGAQGRPEPLCAAQAITKFMNALVIPCITGCKAACKAGGSWSTLSIWSRLSALLWHPRLADLEVERELSASRPC